VIEFMHEGKKPEAASITKTKGARHLVSLMSLTQDFEQFANRKAKEVYSTAVETRNDSNIYTYILITFAIVLSFLTEFFEKIRGRFDLCEVAEDMCEYLAEKLRAQVASFYILEESGDLMLQGDYAFHLRKSLSDKVRI